MPLPWSHLECPCVNNQSESHGCAGFCTPTGKPDRARISQRQGGRLRAGTPKYGIVVLGAAYEYSEASTV